MQYTSLFNQQIDTSISYLSYKLLFQIIENSIHLGIAWFMIWRCGNSRLWKRSGENKKVVNMSTTYLMVNCLVYFTKKKNSVFLLLLCSCLEWTYYRLKACRPVEYHVTGPNSFLCTFVRLVSNFHWSSFLRHCIIPRNSLLVLKYILASWPACTFACFSQIIIIYHILIWFTSLVKVIPGTGCAIIGEGYSRNGLCALCLISTFLLLY